MKSILNASSSLCFVSFAKPFAIFHAVIGLVYPSLWYPAGFARLSIVRGDTSEACARSVLEMPSRAIMSSKLFWAFMPERILSLVPIRNASIVIVFS